MNQAIYEPSIGNISSYTDVLNLDEQWQICEDSSAREFFDNDYSVTASQYSYRPTVDGYVKEICISWDDSNDYLDRAVLLGSSSTTDLQIGVFANSSATTASTRTIEYNGTNNARLSSAFKYEQFKSGASTYRHCLTCTPKKPIQVLGASGETYGMYIDADFGPMAFGYMAVLFAPS